MKKLFTTIMLVLLMTGCVTKTATIKATSSESELISILTENDCRIHKYHRKATTGVVDVVCK